MKKFLLLFLLYGKTEAGLPINAIGGWGRKMDQWIYAKDNEGDGNYPRHSTCQIWMINLAE